MAGILQTYQHTITSKQLIIMSNINDPRRTQEADEKMMDNEEQNRQQDNYRSISSTSDKQEQIASNSPGKNHNDARSMTENPEDNYASQDENAEQEKYRHTTDPQEHMEGPVSSTAKAVGEEMETNETKQEADERQDQAM